jgi:hypothetical protein
LSFYPIFFWERWAAYTNQKAEIELAKLKQKTKSPRGWTKTSAAELKCWVASVIWWCLGATQTFNSFWNEDYERSRIKHWFSEFRWLQLKRFFKVSEPVADETNNGDKLQKVRELWDEFISRCKRYYWPSQQVSIDEAIKKFKGRCSFKQYIKSKPVRWGLKIFCVCCSATGFLWNASIYCGRNDEEDDKAKELGATHQMVRTLLQPLALKNHIAHMDNFFTSIPLFNDLARMRIWACGTIRPNRKGLCPEVSLKKAEESKMKKAPGTSRWASYGSLCYVFWYAKRGVHLLTNCYLPEANDQTGTVLHWFSEKGEKVQKEINRPPAVKYYNLYMGAVDLFDQYRSYTQIDLRSRKFWHPLFWFILESALVNSWLLYKASCQLEKVELRYTFFSFKKSVALALASQWEKMGCRNFNPAESPSQKLRTTSHVKAHLFAKSKTDLFGTRFTEKDKHLSHRQKIPPLEGSTCTKRQLQCQECKKGRTTFWCTECQVPLCKDLCFQLFHTPK